MSRSLQYSVFASILSLMASMGAYSETSITGYASIVAGKVLEGEGHTDSVGTDEHNMTLSQQRAEAVRDCLISKGIAADRLTVKGYGETKPVADNETEEGRFKNRRVELTRRN